MKRLLQSVLIIAAVLTFSVGCESNVYPIPFEMTGPDGPMKLTAVYYPSPSDVPGCFGVISHTDGKDVFSSIWLNFYASDDVKPGEKLRFESITFGAPLSSDSHNSTNTYTGKIILKEKTKNQVVIRMEDVHFSILHGEYTLRGDLVATFSSIIPDYDSAQIKPETRQ